MTSGSTTSSATDSDQLPLEHRKFATIVAISMWFLSIVVVLTGSVLMPDLFENDAFWRITITGTALTVIAIHAFVFPRLSNRQAYIAMNFFAMLATAISVMLFLIAPTAAGVTMLNLLLGTFFAAQFFRGREVVLQGAVATVAALATVLANYDAFARVHMLSRLVAFIPVMWMLIATIYFQQKARSATRRELVRETCTDPLTDCANLRELNRHSRDVLGPDRDGPVGLLLLDLDDFKRTNTLHGHLGGDRLLFEIGRHLLAACDDDQLVARVGGDEFAVLVTGRDRAGLDALARRMRSVVQSVSDFVDLDGVQPDASIGVGYSDDANGTLEDLLTEADREMYAEKLTHARHSSGAAMNGRERAGFGLTPSTDRDEEVSEDAPGLTRQLLTRIGWWDRPFRVRMSLGTWLLGSTSLMLAMAMPDAVHTHLPAVAVLTSVGLAMGIVHYIIAPPMQSLMYRAGNASTLVVIAMMMWATGGLASPASFFLLAFLGYQTWIVEPRELWNFLPGILLVALSPLLYTDALSLDITQAAALYGIVMMPLVTTGILYYNSSGLEREQESLRRLSHTDPLTGLQNRRALQRRIESGLAAVAGDPDARMALVMIDLDDFKEVNTRCGHHEGDLVLQDIGRALNSVTRDGDCLARLGGDEFAAVLNGVDALAAQKLADRLVHAVNDCGRRTAQETGVTVTASAGIALYPVDGRSLDDLLRSADSALRRVKASGKGRAGGADLSSRLSPGL